MNMKNSRGARRGVAKEMWQRSYRRFRREDNVPTSFNDFWREQNDPLHSKAFKADQLRKQRAHKAAA